jgi:hypothetical protein
VGIKAGSRRTTLEYEDDIASFSEEDMDDLEEDVEDEEELDYDYYAEPQSPSKRRRIDDDEEYKCDEDDEEETEERTYFQEVPSLPLYSVSLPVLSYYLFLLFSVLLLIIL